MPGLLKPRRFLFKKIKEIRRGRRWCSGGDAIREIYAGL